MTARKEPGWLARARFNIQRINESNERRRDLVMSGAFPWTIAEFDAKELEARKEREKGA